MNTTTSSKEIIDSALYKIQSVSYKERSDADFSEERVNAFLDAVLALRKYLNEARQDIEQINKMAIELTWCDDVNEEALIKINTIIVLMADLKKILLKRYSYFKTIRSKNIAKKEFKLFKEAIDDLQESYEDLNSVFFVLPSMPDFVETTKKLAAL